MLTRLPYRSLLVVAFAFLGLASRIAIAAPRHASIVFGDIDVPPDSRLEKAVTLDGYHPWTPTADLAAFEARAERTRRQILVAAGLWPIPEKTPLNAVVHGKVARGDFTVERVFFESYPGFFVTGSLFRPSGEARPKSRAAVLCPHGHWRNGRFYGRSKDEARKQIDAGKEKLLPGAMYPLQARCVQLARMGCVVFHYDMVGNADSTQIGHASGFADVDAELRGQSAFGLQTWNSIRALDFVSGLPDVDPKRIGVTGASGGGTQTFILCAIDKRPAVGFPAVMVSTDMQGGCVCENASHLRVGTTNIEFAALAAPRPYGLTGANDWTREIMTKGFPELKSVWRAHGAESKIEAWCYTEFEHNYNQVSREHMYAWFNRHLKLEHDEPIRETTFEPLSRDELTVFTEAHPRPDTAVDARGLRAYLTESSRRQLEALVPSDARSLERFREVVGGALEAMLHTSVPGPKDVESQDFGLVENGSRPFRKLALSRRGAREAVPAVFFTPKDWNGTVVVAVDPRGKRAVCFGRDKLSDGLLQMLDAGAAVLAPDVFLTGEYEGKGVFPKDESRHGRFVGYTYGYNRTLIAQRVHDILTAVAYARSIPGVSRVNLTAWDDAGAWGLLARALAGDSIDRAVFTGLDRFESVTSFDHPNFLPGAVRAGDLPYFAALCVPGELRTVSSKALGDVVARAYRAAGRPEAYRALSVKELGSSEGYAELTAWTAGK